MGGGGGGGGGEEEWRRSVIEQIDIVIRYFHCGKRSFRLKTFRWDADDNYNSEKPLNINIPYKFHPIIKIQLRERRKEYDHSRGWGREEEITDELLGNLLKSWRDNLS